jgi:hypothetical protein
MTAGRSPRKVPSKKWDIEDKMPTLKSSKGRAKKSTSAKSTPAKTLEKRRTKKEMEEERRIRGLVEEALQGNIALLDS